ncbi:MAG: hypothetical protein M0Z58_04850, partial [Nitrospiraceae bacterium]|nr:hypothetical protein [Nitrospiraceae bacterium]
MIFFGFKQKRKSEIRLTVLTEFTKKPPNNECRSLNGDGPLKSQGGVILSTKQFHILILIEYPTLNGPRQEKFSSGSVVQSGQSTGRYYSGRLYLPAPFMPVAAVPVVSQEDQLRRLQGEAQKVWAGCGAAYP